jgi:thiol-disulfide isomerase/thioredoxin
VFTNLDLKSALARSRSEQKLLMVDATAPWCGPCRLMDRTTWLDADVVEWIRSHAIAFQLDVDAHGAAAQKLNVTAMPTVIVFRDGDEIDRVVGFQKPEEMLAWLRALARGVTSLETKRAEIAVTPDDARLRFEYACMLVAVGRLAEAAAEYIEASRRERELLPTCAFDLWRIVRAHPPARTAIAELRDELAPATAPRLEDLRDWLLLNDLLGEAHRSLQWFDDCYGSLADKHDVAELVEDAIGPLLIGAHRWRDVRAMYGARLWRMPVRDLVATWKSARRRLRGPRAGSTIAT